MTTNTVLLRSGISLLVRANVAVWAVFYGSLVLAQCTALLCEFDCREQCRRYFPGGNYVDNACFNSCLSSEDACKAGLPVAKTACSTSMDYQSILLGAKEAKRAGAVNSMGECRNINSWVSAFVGTKGGEMAKTITNVCGCFICEEAMTAAMAPSPSSSADKHRAECDSVIHRYHVAKTSGAPGSVLSALQSEAANVRCPIPQ